jgi:hypothetical protein
MRHSVELKSVKDSVRPRIAGVSAGFLVQSSNSTSDLASGLTRSKSISLSFRERSSRPTTSHLLQELEQRLLAFQSHYERSASPFNWTFTRHHLHALLGKIGVKRLAPAA